MMAPKGLKNFYSIMKICGLATTCCGSLTGRHIFGRGVEYINTWNYKYMN